MSQIHEPDGIDSAELTVQCQKNLSHEQPLMNSVLTVKNIACSILITIGVSFSTISNAVDCDDLTESNVPLVDSVLYQSALEGSAESQFEIGLLYEYGRDVEQNDDTARCWYEQSAHQFYSDAQYRLGVLYDNGWGIGSDKIKAFRFYKSAAYNGHVMAQHDLAMMYFHGVGTTRNLVEAYQWLKIALLSGNDLMQKHLNRVASEMSSEEISLAEYLAATRGSELGI